MFFLVASLLTVSTADSLIVTPDIYFEAQSGGVRVHTNSTMDFSSVSVDSSLIMFNSTSFNISSPNFVNISLISLHSDTMNDSVNTVLLIFGATASANVNFAIGGFTPRQVYWVYVNGTRLRVLKSDSTGTIRFSNDDWSDKIFQVRVGEETSTGSGKAGTGNNQLIPVGVTEAVESVDMLTISGLVVIVALIVAVFLIYLFWRKSNK